MFFVTLAHLLQWKGKINQTKSLKTWLNILSHALVMSRMNFCLILQLKILYEFIHNAYAALFKFTLRSIHMKQWIYIAFYMRT